MAAGAPRRLPAAAIRPLLRLVGRFVLDERSSFATQRARRERLAAADRLPAGVTATAVAVGDGAARRLDPAAADPTRAVLFLHGGGYCIGTAQSYAGFAGQLADRVRCPVLMPDYRLAPEHPHPAALDDALAGWKELAAEVPAERLAVVGDSAGAGLGVALTTTLRDGGEPLPAALGLLSPWLDLAADRRVDPALARRDPLLSPAWLEACARAYAGGHELSDPALSPLRGSLDGLPPTFLVAGGDDVLVSDADRFALAAREAGVRVEYTRVPGLWHDYVLQAGLLAEADKALAQLAAFLDRASTRAPGGS